MPKEMLITLWIIEYSEKNPIKKLKFKISFNYLTINILNHFSSIFNAQNKNDSIPHKLKKSGTIQMNF